MDRRSLHTLSAFMTNSTSSYLEAFVFLWFDELKSFKAFQTERSNICHLRLILSLICCKTCGHENIKARAKLIQDEVEIIVFGCLLCGVTLLQTWSYGVKKYLPSFVSVSSNQPTNRFSLSSKSYFVNGEHSKSHKTSF